MGVTEILQDVVFASVLEGVKKKPVLVIHFLVSVALGTGFLLLLIHAIDYLLGYVVYHPNFNHLLIVSLIITCVLLCVYSCFWHKLRRIIRKGIPEILDNVFASYTGFVQSIMEKTLYDFIREKTSILSIDKVASLFFSYYFGWVFGLYSLDLIVYIFSGYRYTLFGYMMSNPCIAAALLIGAIIIAQFIHPWTKKDEKKEGSRKNIMNVQYLQSFLERFASFEGLVEKSRYSDNGAVRFLLNFLEDLLAFPSLVSFERLFVFDVFEVPYLKSKGGQNTVRDLPGDVVERLIRMDCVEDYRLEPFDREICGKLPESEIPLLRRACWYKVYRRKSSTDRTEWVPVGYAMLLRVRRKGEHVLDKMDFEECMNALKSSLKRNKQYCYEVIKELGRTYLKETDILLVLLLGTQELLGLKLLLT